MARRERKKEKTRRSCIYSKYNSTKERNHRISLQVFLTIDEYRKIIGGMSSHSIPNIRDFLIDNALIVADKNNLEHPEHLQYFFDNPNAFHPKLGNENIFKPKEIMFDIIISDKEKDG